MKKYCLMIPLMIFPYAYLIFLIYMNSTSKTMNLLWGYEVTGNIWSVIVATYLLYTLISVFYNTILSGRGKYTAYESAQVNLFVKGLQVPAYIFHFILGMMAFFMGLWGIGALIVAVGVDLVTILLTGISSIGCSVRMRKEKITNTPAAILMGIGCFLYVVDVVIAVIYFAISRKHSEKTALSPVQAKSAG